VDRDRQLRAQMEKIASGDADVVDRLLSADPALPRYALEAGATRADASANFITEIAHYVYTGDTALHVAAAAHRPEMVSDLVRRGALVTTRNRRGATPLHYAADGGPGHSAWNPAAQAETIACLIDAGADANSVADGGVTPLHRAVRNRCAAAVEALLAGGADPLRANGNGSTPATLALQTTGRSGSGSPEAKVQQAEIIALLERSAGRG
jgi:ankyrin repeat protein